MANRCKRSMQNTNKARPACTGRFEANNGMGERERVWDSGQAVSRGRTGALPIAVVSQCRMTTVNVFGLFNSPSTSQVCFLNLSIYGL